MYDAGLRINRRLDERFGRRTTAGKMTDVPGHTRGIIAPIVAAGVRLVHIGINAASKLPRVPGAFRWRDAAGRELVMIFTADYGGVTIVPGSDAVLAMTMTNDNHGPPPADAIARTYADLRQRFPDAEVVASTLSAFADELLADNPPLPLVTDEIGDTWIHGVGSDPRRVADLLELRRARDAWVAQGRVVPFDAVDQPFLATLLRVPEHTWGLDVKTFLGDWDVYTVPQLAEARRTRENFKRVEASWAEKRHYLVEAVDGLPPDLATRARAAVAALRPTIPVLPVDAAASAAALGTVRSKHFDLRLDDTGAICQLTQRATGRVLADARHVIGRFGYQVFDDADCRRFLTQYLSQRTWWAISDFGKPGLDKVAVRAAWYDARLRMATVTRTPAGTEVLAELSCPTDQPEVTAPPQRLFMRVSLPDAAPRADLELLWLDKAANRVPEASWLTFNPVVADAARWRLHKIDEPVSPLGVVVDGNRHLHAVDGSCRCDGPDGRLSVATLDAPLVAPGRPSLLNFTNEQPDLSAGLAVNLHNNVWGTNFAMWFEDDMRFRFAVDLG